MPVEPVVQQLLATLAALPPVDYATVSPDEMRMTIRMLSAAGDAPDVPRSDQAVAGPAGDIPVRVYEPPGSSPAGPVLVWFHGGGWVIGDLETTDGTVRRLAAASGMRVVSVDYRLAPEHRYPAAVDDCRAAYDAVVDGKLGGPPAWAAVGGDSAGGNLAAVVAQQATRRRPDFQLLIYPVTDSSKVWPSRIENGEGYLLTKAGMDWFEANYFTDDAQRREPAASPILAASLAGLPPAYVLTVELDPLRDEGEAYAAALRDAGVPVEHVRIDGQVHGFFGTPDVFGPTAQAATDAAGAALRRAAGS